MRRLSSFFTSMLALACGDSASDDGAADTGAATMNDDGGSQGTGAVDGSSSGGGPADPCAMSPETLADCVEQQRYVDDLGFIADIRNPGTPHWQAVQDLCFDRLTELGFETQLHDYGTGVNVVGRRVGTTLPDEIVMLGAHYDHLPDCIGADDNGTGVSGILEAARVFAKADFDRTVMVACWDEEETGLEGSEAYVALAQSQGDDIVGYYNYDMIGFSTDEPNTQTIPDGFDLVFPDQIAWVEQNEFRGNFILFVGDELAHDQLLALETHMERVELLNIWVELIASVKNSDLVGDLRRSDHAPFWQADIPAIFMTDSANFRNPNYHCLAGEQDSIDALDHEFAVKVVRATVGAVAQTAGL